MTATLTVAVAAACLVISGLSVLWAVRARQGYLAVRAETSLSYGSIVTGSGRAFPVTALKFRRGALVCSFDISGPFDGGLQMVTLTGADGTAVVSVETDLPSRRAGDRLLLVNALFTFSGGHLS